MKKMKLLALLFIFILGSMFADVDQNINARSTNGDTETPAKSVQLIQLNFVTWHHPAYPLNTGIWETFCQEVEENRWKSRSTYPEGFWLKETKPMMPWLQERLTWALHCNRIPQADSR